MTLIQAGALFGFFWNLGLSSVGHKQGSRSTIILFGLISIACAAIFFKETFYA